ncbi:MAG: alpha/beta hydrolase, partial [Bacteroidia bacterium]|nr:alpha/beta hydrolase [Bacteroidia bacterium]
MDNQVLKMHIENTRNLPIAFDLHLSKARGRRPLVVFCHGFKGFKDWGSFNYIAKCFANAEMHFLKFNFSGNGTTPNDLLNFADVDAFGNNNFSKELEDLDCVLNWVESDFEKTAGCSFSSITLMGHSRGGGIAILKAAKDSRIKKLITWAAVADFEKMLGSYDNEQWKQDGVVYIRNARTNQNMPLHYQLYTD